MVSICRLCASLKKTENLTFIHDSHHDLCQKLLKCCQLTIHLKDVLPKGVCPECIRCLNASFEFYERVHESQQSLEKLLNVESMSKVTNVIPDDDDEVSVKEQKSLALLAAAVGNDESSHESNDINEPLTVSNNDDSDEVTQVINEILRGKGDQNAYIIIGSDTEEDTEKPEVVSEKDVDEINTATDDMIATGTFPSIEFIDDNEELIDFEHNHYEIIEEEEEEEDEGEDIQIEDSIQYESQDAEENVVEEDYTKPSTSLLPNREANDTWIHYPWKCVNCLEVFYSAKQLINHNEKVHRLRPSDMEWLCADCQKPFPRYYTLINHIRQRHRFHLALLCDICNDSCKSFTDLEEHRQEMHADEEHQIMLLCVKCGKGFQTTNSLQIHNKCHLPDDLRLLFACNLCNKKFRTKSNLTFHQKMHAGTRDFVCDQCGKKFIQKANLEEHLLTHVSYTPFECSQCKQLFKTPERLTRHKQRHTDEKPFSCTGCDKKFRTKDSMTTHMRIHTGEMPFSCEFCQKPFRFRSTLMTHHNVHTGTRPYSCVDCDHHFTNWPNYNKHMKRRHGIDAASKNPRGKKPANPPKPLKKPKVRSTTTTKSNFIAKRKTDEEIRDEEAYDIGAECEPEEEINITVPKQEKEEPGDNYEDAI